MALQCPVCEMVQDDAAVACEQCGRVLLTFSEDGRDVPPLEGLVRADDSAATARAMEGDALEGLEPTRHDPVRLAGVERLPVEPTEVSQAVAGPLSFEPGPLELDTGREADDGARTPALVDPGTCPYCGAASTGKLCDNCGRRRSRYLAPAAAPANPRVARGDDEAFCPACFARIVWGARCVECGVPLPLRELL